MNKCPTCEHPAHGRDCHKRNDRNQMCLCVEGYKKEKKK